jgi:hypothetical protein
MFAEMALEIWKWRFPWPLRIFSASVGNDFQQPRANERFGHFQMFSISTLLRGDGLRWTSLAGPGRGGPRPRPPRRDPERTTSRAANAERGDQTSGSKITAVLIVQFGEGAFGLVVTIVMLRTVLPTAKGTGPINRPAPLAAERQAQSLGIWLHLSMVTS